MSKPFYLLLTCLIAAGSLFGQTEATKSPATTEAAKPPTVRDPAKPSAEQSPPPAIPAESAATKSTDKGPIGENPPAFDVNNMDTSVKPQDDFYTYANGGWLKKTPIPPEESRWGSFNQLIEKNTEALRVVAEKASKAPVKGKPNPEVQKVGDYYASGMDEAAIEAAKATPLADEFKRIEAMKDRGDVLKEIAHLHNLGVERFSGSPRARTTRTAPW